MVDAEDYTVGWVCAISTEYVAARAFLDEKHDGPEYTSPNDNNIYTLGRVGKHKVVIAVLPNGEYGLAAAAGVARDMLHSFPNIRIGLMVGIGGGAPSRKHDIRLGDIVVSAPRDGKGGVFQYDFGKTIQDQSFQTTGFLNQPPTLLRAAVSDIAAEYEAEGHQLEEAIESALERLPRLRKKYKRPDSSSDRLYKSGYIHPRDDELGCLGACGEDPSYQILRAERTDEDDNPAIHYGLIASANQLMKNAVIRDKLAAKKDVLCFEMEAAGLMNHFPCLVIRGICDYSDSHKNKEWQGYAAMTAAAYAKDLIRRIPPSKVEAEKRIGEVLSVVKDVREDVSNLVCAQSNRDHDMVLNWLTPTEYGPQHHDYITRCEPGTGQWLLASTEFHHWLETSNQTLFCPGIPGAGKTFQTSLLIKDLVERFQDDPMVGIAYIYCNFQRQQDQKPEKLLECLIKQLAQHQKTFPESLQASYVLHQNRNTRPLLEELSVALQSVGRSYSRVFIVIDALDECDDTDRSRTKLLNYLFDTQNNRMSYLPDFVKSDIGLQNEIKDGIESAIEGMFLLAQLYIDMLVGKRSPAALRNTLKGLRKASAKSLDRSSALDDAYSKAMERIQQQRGDLPRDALLILSWIVNAKRQLTVPELQDALAVEIGKSELDKDNVPTIEHITSACAPLVVVDRESNIVRLVHYTTQEYFKGTQQRWFPTAEADITEICTTYLSFSVFESGVCLRDNEFEQRLKSNPLFEYAAHNWGHHAREASTLCQGVIEFLQKQSQVEASSQALMASERRWDSRNYSQKFPTEMTGLHLGAYFGVYNAVQFILGSNNPDPKDSYNQTPLYWASKNGYLKIVQLLLDRGADVKAASENNQTPLHWASKYGNVEIVQLLLDRGADINIADEHGWTPLYWAFKNSNREIIQLLLDRGAEVNTADKNGWTLLHSASKYGHLEVVQLLLDRGADINTVDKDGWTSLHWASENRYSEIYYLNIVQLLLDRGADVKVANKKGWTPLHLASKNGYLETVQLLLDRGADINIADKDGWTPLHWASKNDYLKIVQLLLNRGGDINIVDKDRRTPLHKAYDNDYLEIVQLLLDRGAEVNTANKDNQTPLHLASGNGDVEIVQLLLDRGADIDINTADKDNQTPLHLASGNSDVEIVQLLLDRGADINIADKDGWTPLHWASEDGYFEIVQLLLDRGANVNTSEDGLTPLHLASKYGHLEVVQLLLDRGADINTVDKDGWTSLHWASENRYSEIYYLNIVQLLLDRGADVKVADKKGWTPLHLASKNGYLKTVQLLLDRGADVKAASENNQTPLHLASGNGDIEIVQLLLDRGADINIADKNSQTPLHLASEYLASKYGHLEILQLLLDRGADINVADKNGWTLLHWASKNRELEIFQLLLDRGADININIADKNSQTPLHLASGNGEVEIVQLLLDRGAEVNIADKNSQTPLHLASGNGKVEIVQLLLDRGANINIADKDGWTPLYWASKNRYSEIYYFKIVQLLLDRGADVKVADKKGWTPLHLASKNSYLKIVQLLLDRGADINTVDKDGWTPLKWASENSNLKIVQLLLDRGADPIE
ncbi:hypothetical protein ACMFMG_011084 [Clarireedia jacksonii]